MPTGNLGEKNELSRVAIAYLSMTLKWPARFLIDVDDDTIGVTRQVYAHVNLNLCHLFVNFCLEIIKIACCGMWKIHTPFSQVLSS